MTPPRLAPQRLWIGGPRRGADRLDHDVHTPAEAVEALISRLGERPVAAVTLVGGEPTLRADLPSLLRRLTSAGVGNLGMFTDGLALVSGEAAGSLVEAGLKRVRVELGAFQPEAHDWLVNQPGAQRRALKAIRACRAAGLSVEVEIPLTRPAVDHLPELVGLVLDLGASWVRVRRVTKAGPAARDFVALSPRLGLTQPALERAWDEAARRRRPLTLHGLPACAAGRAAEGVRVDADEPLIGGPAPLVNLPGCARCPGGSACAGAPQDYVERFGWAELRSEERPHSPPPPQAQEAAAPPPRAGRAPATRVLVASRLAQRPSLYGDPLADAPVVVPRRLRVSFRGPSPLLCPDCGDHPLSLPTFEPTREIRRRLAAAAQEGAEILEIGGGMSLAHPDVIELLREAGALSARRVEAWGDGAALAELPDKVLRRLKGVHRIDLALYGPDAPRHDAHAGRPGAFFATMRALAALHEAKPELELGVYALLHNLTDLLHFDQAWRDGLLPFSPRYALSPSFVLPQTLSAEERSALLRGWPSPAEPPAARFDPSGQEPPSRADPRGAVVWVGEMTQIMAGSGQSGPQERRHE
ncbi:MAG: radical SAM protein [Deltaproteobacteria bacterium]|nr:radical SAM protein [Deltaproteobacteria bacterium]